MNKEHILVCLSSAPSNANIIRAAADIAKAFDGTLTALYVKTKASENMGADDRRRLVENTTLAENSGAEISTVGGDDVAYQIAEFARHSKVTKVVIGESPSARSRIFTKDRLSERLTSLAPELEIYIIPDISGENTKKQNPSVKESVFPNVRQLSIALIMPVLSTVVGMVFRDYFITESNTITVYILGAIITGVFTGNKICSIIASLISVLMFNFFFAEPVMNFKAYESGHAVTFALMLIASLITGTLSNRLSVNAKHSAQAAWHTKVLLETNQLLQKADDEEKILSVTISQLIKLLNRKFAVFSVKDGNTLCELNIEDTFGSDKTFSADITAAQAALKRAKRTGAFTKYSHETEGQYLLMRSESTIYGVVGILIGEKPLEPFENSVLISVLGEGAFAMENMKNAKEKEEAAIMAKNEQLRSNLLRTISHDLRTPLTSISGNAENLLANDEYFDSVGRRQVLSDIYDDSIWLIQLVENLLSITRIGEGITTLNLSAQLVDEVITEALRHIPARNTEHIIKTQITDELLLANMDARLISQVIVNLVDNAVKYTPSGSEITVCAEKRGGMAYISVSDNGPGIADELKERAFDMFYTGNNSVADCRRSMGLGLSLCKSIVNLHGGEITLTDNTPNGCVFTFTLPLSEVILNE